MEKRRKELEFGEKEEGVDVKKEGRRSWSEERRRKVLE